MALTNQEALKTVVETIARDIKANANAAQTAQATAAEAKQSALQAQQTAQQINGAVEQAIATAKREVKDEILGGASADLDTLKEIADAMKTAGGDTNAAMVSKMSEQNQRIDGVEAVLNVDYLQAYNTAKNAA